MKALVQKVLDAKVSVDGQTVGEIGPGLLVFLGYEVGDSDAQWRKCVDKLMKLRIFEDDQGKMNLDVRQTNGSLLLISQFTLAADTSRGNRPGFDNAMRPEEAQVLYNDTIAYARELLPGRIETGRFGAMMKVALVNDGPCTFMLEFPASKI